MKTFNLNFLCNGWFSKNKKNASKLYFYLTEILRFTPKDFSLYEQAFVHRSCNSTSNNERLEFLGDAILDAVIADFLFTKYPNQNEGYLTLTRSKIVNRENMCILAKKLGMPEHIKANLPKEHIEKKISGNVLEAFIGAIYLDKGFLTAKQFIIQQIIGQFVNFNTLTQSILKYKTALIHLAQKHKLNLKFTPITCKNPKTENQFGVEVTINNNSYGKAYAESKKKAEENAAKTAYEKYTKTSDFTKIKNIDF